MRAMERAPAAPSAEPEEQGDAGGVDPADPDLETWYILILPEGLELNELDRE
jgi:hypothetical protein